MENLTALNKNIRKIGLFFLLGLMGVTINSCYYDSREELYPTQNNTCDTANVLFSTSVTTVLQANCWSCHNNANFNQEGGGIALENYTDVKAIALDGRLMSVVNQDGSYSPMPKDQGKIDDCSIRILEKWIELGFPE